QIDVQPDRATAALLRPAVGRLHEARAAAGDDSEARLREAVAGRARLRVARVVLADPRRAEARHPADVGQRREAARQLVVDALDALAFGELRPDGGALGAEDLLVWTLGPVRIP